MKLKYIFFHFSCIFLHQVYLRLWIITEKQKQKNTLGWGCWWRCCTVPSKTTKRQSVFAPSRRLGRHPFLVQLDFWGEHRLKLTSLITVWIVSSFAKDWSISRYTGSVGSFVFSQWTLCSPRRCTITHFSAMCVWVGAGGGFGLKNNRKQKKNILHWHSDLALTAFGCYWTGAVDRCK